mgnify:CR=1 FL=1
MKNKFLKTLLISTTALPLVTTLGLFSVTSCSKKRKDDKLMVTGTVRDIYGQKLSDVYVSCNGVSTKTDSDGEYTIECTKASAPIYFEKHNYLAEVITEYSFDSPVDILLSPYKSGTVKTITGVVKDSLGHPIPNCSVAFYPDSDWYYKRAQTDENGAYSVDVITQSNGSASIPFTINCTGIDYSEQILKVTHDVSSYDLIAQPYQYDIKALILDSDASKNIIMHAHHIKNQETNESALEVKFEANFLEDFEKSADEARSFKLTVNADERQSSPKETEITGYDFSISFNSKDGVTSSEGQYIIGDDDEVGVVLSQNKLCLTVTIPDTFYVFTNIETIGLHLTGDGGKFEPYDHKESNTTAANQLCYVRLDKDNHYYQASDNVNPYFGLSWDNSDQKWSFATYKNEKGETQTLIGTVGHKYNFGYQIKLAKNTSDDKGIYILTKYMQDQMSDYLPDVYKPHFFFDTHKYEEGKYPNINKQPSNDGMIKNYSPYSGYWMQKFKVVSPTEAEDETYEYNDFFDSDDARVYEKDDLMITYIPYSSLGISVGNEFGFTCNLQYEYTEKSQWFKWNDKNPTGFNGADVGERHVDEWPHFEDLVSYIRFDSDFHVIPYTEA